MGNRRRKRRTAPMIHPTCKISRMARQARNPRSMLGFYRRDVFPRLTEAGFVGTVAKSEKTLPMSQYWAEASGRAGELRVKIAGYEDHRFQTLLNVELNVGKSDQAEAITDVVSQVQTALRHIDAANATVRNVESLSEALNAFLKRMASKLGAINIARLDERGREFVVHLDRAVIATDRMTLVTLVRDIWGEGAFPDRTVSFHTLREMETIAYLEQLAKLSEDEARTLFVHVYSPHQTHFDQDSIHPLASLFPTPHCASRELNSAASFSHLIRRAIPRAQEGSLTDRVAALSVIDDSLVHVTPEERYALEIAETLPTLAASLASDDAPILRESAWWLERRLSWARRTRNWKPQG